MSALSAITTVLDKVEKLERELEMQKAVTDGWKQEAERARARATAAEAKSAAAEALVATLRDILANMDDLPVDEGDRMVEEAVAEYERRTSSIARLDPTERAALTTERLRQFLAAVRGHAQMGELDGVLRAVDKLLEECRSAEAKVAAAGEKQPRNEKGDDHGS